VYRITAETAVSLFCHFEEIKRIYVVSAHEKSRFYTSLTEERYLEAMKSELLYSFPPWRWHLSSIATEMPC
jgi:hypothetical protein